MRRVCLLALLLLASSVAAAPGVKKTAVTTDNGASCDISTSPAATLLLPRFEVDVDKHPSEAMNTIFSVINTSRSPQIARITIWTDQGYPALWFNVFLTGYDVQPISLYDVLVSGLVPETGTRAAVGPKSAPNDANPKLISTEGCLQGNVALPPALMADIRSMLTTGVAKGKECKVGTAHDKAVGYVTVDLVNSCSLLSPLDITYYSQLLLFDNVLTGDYELINPDKNLGNYAGGNPFVHLKAIPEGGTAQSAASPLPYTFYDRYTPTGARRIDRRQPLPSVFAARFIQGGTTAFSTDYVIWREGTVSATQDCAAASNASVPVTSVVRFDEDENPTLNAPAVSQSMPLTSSLSTTSSFFPPLVGLGVSGWMFLNLDNRLAGQEKSPYSTSRPSQNWVLVSMRAEGRYGVAYDATAMANGCTPTQAVAKTPGGPQ
ncbi:MAG TPA: hypothetical protein VGR02_17460 [Thermoanaerobaculia bacterium]|jgi:hypothetical protein|nr:hypothetical protein [Thermoanaerobaculia bacterium]